MSSDNKVMITHQVIGDDDIYILKPTRNFYDVPHSHNEWRSKEVQPLISKWGYQAYAWLWIIREVIAKQPTARVPFKYINVILLSLHGIDTGTLKKFISDAVGTGALHCDEHNLFWVPQYRAFMKNLKANIIKYINQLLKEYKVDKFREIVAAYEDILKDTSIPVDSLPARIMSQVPGFEGTYVIGKRGGVYCHRCGKKGLSKAIYKGERVLVDKDLQVHECPPHVYMLQKKELNKLKNSPNPEDRELWKQLRRERLKLRGKIPLEEQRLLDDRARRQAKKEEFLAKLRKQRQQRSEELKKEREEKERLKNKLD